jgi:hypothetical protein
VAQATPRAAPSAIEAEATKVAIAKQRDEDDTPAAFRKGHAKRGTRRNRGSAALRGLGGLALVPTRRALPRD